MSIQEIRKSYNWSIEEASDIFGIDAETLIEIEASSKPQNMWAINIILGVLQLDYEDIVLAS